MRLQLLAESSCSTGHGLSTTSIIMQASRHDYARWSELHKTRCIHNLSHAAHIGCLRRLSTHAVLRTLRRRKEDENRMHAT